MATSRHRPAPSLAIAALGSLFLSCQEPAPPSYFGRWEDTDAGRSHRPDAATDDAAPPALDAAALTCHPSVIGGGDDLRTAAAPLRSRHPARSSASPPTHKPTDDDDDKYVVADSKCLSGWRWIGGQHESKLMQPGSDCLRCHRPGNDDDHPRPGDDDDEAPGYVVAGTVYGALNEPSDCLGVEGVTIRITDAQGQRIERTSNRAGNFYIKSKGTRLALPITAEISAAGRTRKMQHAQCLTSCNACHSSTGVSGAKGRLLVP